MRFPSPAVPDFRAAAARARAVHRAARAVIMCLALTAGAPARAWDEVKTDLRLSLLDDVTTGAGSVLASVRYGGAWGLKAGYWVRDVHVQPSAPNFLVGGNYVLKYSRWRAGAGVIWIDQENANNGTRWNFDLMLAYDLTDRIFCEYQHNSHGSILGIKKG